MSLDQVRALERATLNALPAPRIHFDGPFVAKAFLGGTGRANAACSLDPAPDPGLAARLERIVALYRRLGLTPRIRSSPLDPPGLHGEADLALGLADDLDAVSGISAVGEAEFHESPATARGAQQRRPTVAILERCGMRVQHQAAPVGIHHRMALAALDLLAPIVERDALRRNRRKR